MPRSRIMVPLNDELRAALDGEASRRGVSRAALTCQIIEHHLHQSDRAATGRRIIEGYQRLPQVLPDSWSTPRMADAALHELAQRLDAEESELGLNGW